MYGVAPVLAQTKELTGHGLPVFRSYCIFLVRMSHRRTMPSLCPVAMNSSVAGNAMLCGTLELVNYVCDSLADRIDHNLMELSSQAHANCPWDENEIQLMCFVPG